MANFFLVGPKGSPATTPKQAAQMMAQACINRSSNMRIVLLSDLQANDVSLPSSGRTVKVSHCGRIPRFYGQLTRMSSSLRFIRACSSSPRQNESGRPDFSVCYDSHNSRRQKTPFYSTSSIAPAPPYPSLSNQATACSRDIPAICKTSTVGCSFAAQTSFRALM